MKKRNLFVLGLAGLLLVSCGEGGTGNDGSSSSNPPVAGGNTLSSVLSSFGKNCRVNNIYQYLSSGSVPSIMTDYVEDGFYSTYKNFGDRKNGGVIDVKGDKSYRYIVEKDAETKKDKLVLGDALVDGNGNNVSSFRDLYFDPSYIGDHVAMFTAENVFVPKIQGTTFGTFNLFGKYYSDDAPVEESSSEGVAPAALDATPTLIKDNTAELTALSKALGVYEVAANHSDKLELQAADLYFSEKGTQFTFNFYYSYEGGFDRLVARSVISKIGSTSVDLIKNYNK